MVALKQVESCPLCGSRSREFLFSGREHEYPETTSQGFDFHRCRECSLVYLAPRPDESELPIIYPKRYYSQVSVNASPADLDLSSFSGRMLHKRLLGRMVGNMAPFLKPTPLHSILDVGCGGGRSLKSLHTAFGCETVGIDMDVSDHVAAQYSSAPMTVIRGNFMDYDFGGRQFDVVYASHLIEHLANPIDFMRKAHACIKPGGLCILETPNVECLAFRMFGKHWGGNHIPRHWFMLSPVTARTIGEKSVPGGWELLDVRFAPNAAFWIWTFHSWLVGAGLRPLADVLFPSDHRIVSVTPMNIARHGFFTVIDGIVKLFTGRTGNMSLIYRRTVG